MDNFRILQTESFGDILLTKMHYDDLSCIRVSMFMEEICVESHIVIQDDNHIELVSSKFQEIQAEEMENICIDLAEAYANASVEEIEDGIEIETNFYDNDPSLNNIH